MQKAILAMLSLVLVLLCVLIYRLETGATIRAGIASMSYDGKQPSFIIPGQAAELERNRQIWERAGEQLRGAGAK